MHGTIVAEGLTKVFRTYDRRPGFWGSLRDVVDRRHKDVHAVAGVSLSIPRGEIVGYIGPNGAGKSTTIKMLTGILRPTAGTVRVNGLDPQRQRAQHARQVGAVFGQRSQLWWDLAVGESFELLRHLYRVDPKDFKQRLDHFDGVLGLSEFLATPVRKLSLGQRMKADLAASMLHAPPILFLDEPTVGLDIVTKARLRDCLADMNRRHGITILLTTHDLQDIEALSTRVVVIDHGKIMHDGGLARLKEVFGGRKRLVLTLREPSAIPDLLPGIIESWTQPQPNQLVASLAPHADTAQVLQAALTALPVADVRIEEPSIEDVVTRLYAGRAA